jgi:hypothetical protein
MDRLGDLGGPCGSRRLNRVREAPRVHWATCLGTPGRFFRFRGQTGWAAVRRQGRRCRVGPGNFTPSPADNSKIASKDPSRKTNSREGGELIVESIAYYGTYTVNETERAVILHLDASTFPNQIGTDQKRTITSLTADELKYSHPAAMSGVQVHQVWKRA